MLGSDDFCSTRIISHLRDESGDEELSVLPRHTKVIVTGNNRTKSVLLGLQGVVKKAVGLGGWHWLVLKNGIEVKLQRNALSVLEHPTGNEVDDDLDVDSGSGSDGEKDLDFSSGSEFLKPRKPRVQSMKPMIQSAAMKYPSNSSYKDIQSSLINVPKPKVDLTKLGTDSLWRYCSHYNIVGINDHSSREEMLNAVQQHFVSQQPLDETRVLADFTQAAKRMESGSPKE